MTTKTAALARLHELTYDRVVTQLRQTLGMVGWWLLCIVIPVLAVVTGTIYGAIVGAASGAYAGIAQAKSDLTRWLEAMTR